jgi:hypothetical protein
MKLYIFLSISIFSFISVKAQSTIYDFSPGKIIHDTSGFNYEMIDSAMFDKAWTNEKHNVNYDSTDIIKRYGAYHFCIPYTNYFIWLRDTVLFTETLGDTKFQRGIKYFYHGKLNAAHQYIFSMDEDYATHYLLFSALTGKPTDTLSSIPKLSPSLHKMASFEGVCYHEVPEYHSSLQTDTIINDSVVHLQHYSFQFFRPQEITWETDTSILVQADICPYELPAGAKALYNPDKIYYFRVWVGGR